MHRRRTPVHSNPEVTPSSDRSSGAESVSSNEDQPRIPTARSPRDLLVPYILLAVSLQRAYGYLIEEYLKSLGFFGVDKSLLYRTLRQLEKEGLLLSSWEMSPTGPARRVYTLTEVGQFWLDSWSTALAAYRSMIDAFFALYTGGGTPPEGSPRGGEPDETAQEG